MQFTSQQLTGGAKYGIRVRIGNWREDAVLEEESIKNYLKRKDEGQLYIINKQVLLEKALQPVFKKPAEKELEPQEKRFLHFDDLVMWKNADTQGFLSASLQEPVPKGYEAYSVTSSPNDIPCVRNVFVLERVNNREDSSIEVEDHQSTRILYEKSVFKLRLVKSQDCMQTSQSDEGSVSAENETPQTSKNEASVSDLPLLFLESESTNPINASCSKTARKQEVLIGAKSSGGQNLWQVVCVDPKKRFDTYGTPVMASDDICLRHVQTGSFLSSDKQIDQRNMFGREYEVHCHCYFSVNKTHNLISEKTGKITADYALRRMGTQSVWKCHLL